jgi:hypothetical protein
MPIGNATWGDFTCNTQAEMLADARPSIGTTCLRTDDLSGGPLGTIWECVALPSNNIANWVQANSLVLSEVTPYVTLTASGIAFSGPCELAGFYCSVAAGNITIYDALSAVGTPIVPATALVAGPAPIFGAGSNGKLALVTGCYVVLSGAATVRVLVQ